MLYSRSWGQEPVQPRLEPKFSHFKCRALWPPCVSSPQCGFLSAGFLLRTFSQLTQGLLTLSCGTCLGPWQAYLDTPTYNSVQRPCKRLPRQQQEGHFVSPLAVHSCRLGHPFDSCFVWPCFGLPLICGGLD